MSERLGTTHLRLDNGTVWPDPYVDPRDLDEPARTHFTNSALSAYAHLAAHPIGTEATIKTLRDLRRAAAKHRLKRTG